MKRFKKSNASPACQKSLFVATMMLMSSFRSAATRLPLSRLDFPRRALSTALREEYEFVKASKEGKVGVIQLHRPKALNALCDALFDDLIHAGRAFDQDEQIGCMVLTGSPKAFAAGADIAEMSTKTFGQVYSAVRSEQRTSVLCVVFLMYVDS
jgi:1,4-dihydroxy-2-naphthoyl-CoA synthase